MSVLLASLFGLILGSFANVYFFRLVENSFLWRPGSSCPICRKLILWRDNIPLLSYFLLRGRCRFCRAPISIRYPAVELAVGVLFGAAAFKFSGASPFVAGAFLFFVLFVFLAGGADLATFFKFEKQYGIIPDSLSIPLIFLGVLFSRFNPLLSFGPWTGLVSGAQAALSLILFRWIAGKILGQEALGLGDVKLMTGAAAWLGLKGTVTAITVGSALGTGVCLTLIFMGKVTRKSAIPFGPFLSAGILSAFFFF